MTKILVYYWKEKDLIPELKHGIEFDYSAEKCNEIIQIILDLGLSVMARPNIGENGEILLIWIDKNRFGQS